MEALRTTRDLGLEPDYSGKVRDIFDLGEQLFIVSTDRISAYDVIMNDLVPGRGIVLNVMTLAWLKQFSGLRHHVISAQPEDFPAPFKAHAASLGGRSLLVHKAERFPVECVVRGYITGSGWRSYQENGTVCGQALPAGLQRAQKLPVTLFTPSTKADEGHDENISFAEVVQLVGREQAEVLRTHSLRLYEQAAAFAESKGVLLADTKFEFGLIGGELAIIDEVLTPDSSRFWPADAHQPGQEPPSWDKQILRNHLDTLSWNHQPPPPALPVDILTRTAARYHEVLQILFPEEIQAWRKYLR